MAIEIMSPSQRGLDVEPLQPRHWALAHLNTCASPALQRYVERHGWTPALFSALANPLFDYSTGVTIAGLVSAGVLPPAAAGVVDELHDDVVPDVPDANTTTTAEDPAMTAPETQQTATDPLDGFRDARPEATPARDEGFGDDVPTTPPTDGFDDPDDAGPSPRAAATKGFDDIPQIDPLDGFDDAGYPEPTPARPGPVDTSTAAFGGGGGF